MWLLRGQNRSLWFPRVPETVQALWEILLSLESEGLQSCLLLEPGWRCLPGLVKQVPQCDGSVAETQDHLRGVLRLLQLAVRSGAGLLARSRPTPR